MVQKDNTDLALGKDLYTRDGDHIGKVKEIQGGLVKVDAPLQPDYWLSASAIDQPLGNDLHVVFTKDQLSDYKVDAPAAGKDETITTGSPAAASGYKPTTVPYATGFTAGLADKEWPEAESIYQQEWEREHAASGQRWEEAAPGYRYAHGMSRDPAFQGRSWDQVADDMEVGYTQWCIDEGYAESDRDWARSAPFTREAWILIGALDSSTVSTLLGCAKTHVHLTVESGYDAPQYRLLDGGHRLWDESKARLHW